MVVMIRTSHDVNMSSAERSVAANKSGADILIRLHADSMDNSSVYGALSTCMTAQNPYNASLHDKSYNLSKKIVDTVCGTTGTKNRGDPGDGTAPPISTGARFRSVCLRWDF